MKKGMNSVIIWTIFAITSLEIIFYFAYIYRPFDRLSRKTIGDTKEIPNLSEILTPKVVVGEDVKIDDSLKSIYLGKLDNYSNLLRTSISAGNSFVKVAKSGYVVSGTVEAVKPGVAGSANSRFEISFKNALGARYTESIDLNEVENIKVSLILMSKDFPGKSDSSLTGIEPGDYLILEKSVNLLNANNKFDINAEILRSVN